jgi:hypothetical protein
VEESFKESYEVKFARTVRINSFLIRVQLLQFLFQSEKKSLNSNPDVDITVVESLHSRKTSRYRN